MTSLVGHLLQILIALCRPFVADLDRTLKNERSDQLLFPDHF